MPTVTSADGTTIAYETTGRGPALILVDGAMSYRDFGPARGLAQSLADRFTVYFYDPPGSKRRRMQPSHSKLPQYRYSSSLRSDLAAAHTRQPANL